jgi:hypothetical protein
LLPIVAQCWTAVQTARGVAPNVAVMHNRRCAWLTAAQDATTRPVFIGELADGDDIFGRRRVCRQSRPGPARLLQPRGSTGEVRDRLDAYVALAIPMGASGNSE